MHKRVIVALALVVAGTVAMGQVTIKGRTNTGSFEKESSASVPNDNAGPEIKITEPVPIATRGFQVISSPEDYVTESSVLLLKGITKDPNGVVQVKVNQQDAMLVESDEGYTFEREVLLSPGRNVVEVVAIDKFRNQQSVTFTVKKEATVIFGKYHALVIAVQNYSNIQRLQSPVQDANKFIEVLTRNYTFDATRITFLVDPDRRKIINEFENLKKRLNDEDNLLIFYAGHGYWDKGIEEGYWLPVDASQDDPSGWISNSDVRNYIRGIKTKHTLLIADACFSGGVLQTREAFTRPDAPIERMYKVKSRKAITSGVLELVPDNSKFLEVLVRLLDENQSQYVDAEKLYSDLRDPVMANSKQIPKFGTIYDSGDAGLEGQFIFVKRRKEAGK